MGPAAVNRRTALPVQRPSESSAMKALDEPLANSGRASRSSRPRVPIAARVFARRRSLTLAERVVYGVTWSYALVFALFAVARHLAFQTQRFDLGVMTQAIWETLHGHFLEVTTQRGEQITRLAVHVDPFLALLAPLWAIWPSPLML